MFGSIAATVSPRRCRAARAPRRAAGSARRSRSRCGAARRARPRGARDRRAAAALDERERRQRRVVRAVLVQVLLVGIRLRRHAPSIAPAPANMTRPRRRHRPNAALRRWTVHRARSPAIARMELAALGTLDASPWRSPRSFGAEDRASSSSAPEVVGGDVILPRAGPRRGRARCCCRCISATPGTPAASIEWVALRVTPRSRRRPPDPALARWPRSTCSASSRRSAGARARTASSPSPASPSTRKRSLSKFVLFDVAERARAAPLALRSGTLLLRALREGEQRRPAAARALRSSTRWRRSTSTTTATTSRSTSSTTR